MSASKTDRAVLVTRRESATDSQWQRELETVLLVVSAVPEQLREALVRTQRSRSVRTKTVSSVNFLLVLNRDGACKCRR
jgi:hypothetical protein